MFQQQSLGGRCQPGRGLTFQAQSVKTQQLLYHPAQILPLSKRWQTEPGTGQPVKQVFAELAAAHHGHEVPVAG